MIKIKGTSVTLCKLIFQKSSKKFQNFNWVYNNSSKLKYNFCDCNNINCCKSPYQKNSNVNY